MKLQMVHLFFILFSFCAGLMGQDSLNNHSQALMQLDELTLRANQALEEAPWQAITLAGESLDMIREIKSKGYLSEAYNEVLSRKDILTYEAESYWVLGQANESQNDLKIAERYYSKGFQIAQRSGNVHIQRKFATAIQNMEVSEKKGIARLGRDIRKGFTQILKSKEVSDLGREVNEGQMKRYARLANKAAQEGKYADAMGFYKLAIQNADKLSDSTSFVFFQQEMLKLRAIQGDSFAAVNAPVPTLSGPPELNSIIEVPVFTDSLSLAEVEVPMPDIKPMKVESEKAKEATENSRKTAESLEERGDFKRASEAYKTYAEQAERYAHLVSQLSLARTDSLQRELDIRELQKDRENQQSLLEKREAEGRLMMLSLLSIIVLTILLTILFLTQRRSNKEISKAYEDLNEAHGQLKAAQTKLVESEKMASLGQLSAGIAHEINNTVNFISGNIEPLKRDIADLREMLGHYETHIESQNLEETFQPIFELKEEMDLAYVEEEMGALIDGIEEGAQRTTEIVKGLRNFARMDGDIMRPFDLHKGLDSTVALLKNQSEKVEIVKEYGSLPEVDCFAGKINQVFMNLLTNAIQAMPEGGTITLRTWHEGDQVHVAVQDTGEGISPDIVGQIFEPFFTTKDIGEGTGLGLSICHGIVEHHNGKIEVDSEPGKGTTMTLILPVNNPSAT